ncbi:MAG: HAMP domain-containing sensor histidine kinase [Polyangiaceae bacterium]
MSGASAVVASAHDITARREAELAKDDLISVVSHELRTPLTAILGALSLLSHSRQLGLEANEGELFDIATENASRLGRLLDDLLDVQKLGAAHIDLVLQTVPVDLVIQRAVALVAPLSLAAGCAVEVCTPGEELMVTIDQGRILQVLSNLLSNALKHSPPGGTVTVEVAATAERVRVRVIDEGPGIPAEFRSRIFGRFAQADTSSARKIAGAGLGLYIARQLIEHHHGELGFEDDRSAGAAFFFELPRASPSPDRSLG